MSAIRQNLTPAHPSRLLPDHGKSNRGIWAAANQPDGQITKSLSSPSGKNSSLLPSGKSALGLPPSCPSEGRIARRHERGAGCGGREGVRHEWQSQGGMNLVSGQLACKMIGALADGEAVWF